MYRVLIAEDSKPIMRNLKELITTSGLPVQIVHTASNGADALATFNEQEVDILLTDIRMPKMQRSRANRRSEENQPPAESRPDQRVQRFRIYAEGDQSSRCPTTC